ncbi:MAG: 3-hydroxyacyl-CoA dehydrogenase NAD-binding domain-containing protein [Rhodospirillales bacterium]|nr:3-hydroxyacyl-CoA dehydrogenase NAD-binding domain-containing protein [Rhodospirillales bacterium]
MKAAVVGLGTMGPGLAATLARCGMEVRAFDVSAEQRAKAPGLMQQATGVLGALSVPDKSAGKMPAVVETLAECCRGADLVVETVPEKLDIKSAVFKEIDGLVGKNCVIASNTSGIPITKLQANVSNPGRVVGMHWSNPAHVIPMIEVIAGKDTAPETVRWMCETIKGLNLLPVVVQKDVPGFVENRILYALLRECVDLVEQGVIDAEGLDTCVSWGIGYKLSVIGPMALLDMAGLDIYEAVGSYLNKDLCNRADVAKYVTDRTAAGKLGMKAGGGIFRYTPEQVSDLRMQRAKKLVAVRKALES